MTDEKSSPRKPRAKTKPKTKQYVSDTDVVVVSGAQIATFVAGVAREIPTGMVEAALAKGCKEQ